jgi:hypothetical protein
MERIPTFKAFVATVSDTLRLADRWRRALVKRREPEWFKADQ